MRWDELFDDLESQLEHDLDAERVDLLAEEERLRLGRLAFRDRLAAMCGTGPDADGDRRAVELVLRDGSALAVAPESSGRDWIAGGVVGAGRTRHRCVVPITAIASAIPRAGQLAASVGAAPLGDPDRPGAALAARLGIAFVLRDLCRRRVPVDLTASWGRLHGTIDRIGRDHLDLAEHEPGTVRRMGTVRQTRLVPFAELLLVRF
jgi:hypothetical protein